MNNNAYWILTTEYPPHSSGGISTYCYETSSMLRDNGYTVTVFICDYSLSADKVSVENGVRIVRFVPEKTGVHNFLGLNAALSYEYANIIKSYREIEGNPLIIESQEYQGIAYYLQQFKLLGYPEFANLNIVITCHAPSFLCLEYNHVPIYKFPEYWVGQMERSSIKAADLLISPSRYFVTKAKERMNWDGINEYYVVNPIKVEANQVIPDYHENHIVCFGKLSPLKGTFQLIQYFKELWDDGFMHPLRIIGGTDQFFHPEAMTMKDIITKKYGIYIEKKLLLLSGELSPEKAKQELRNAHVVLVPSIVDNLPYTVLEAMSWGKVVLASKQGGQSEVISDGENGFLFDHFTPNDFQNKLQYILQLDKDSLRNIADKAVYTVASGYSPAVVYTKKIKLIETYFRTRKTSKIFPFIQQKSTNEQLPVSFPVGNLLSIVIPFFNMGEYIEECIQSVLSSDYSSKEIIIVNDGSTDKKSIAILEELVKKYPVTIYHKKNEGLSLTRNLGATKATGDYLAFLDADDTVQTTYYSKAINVLKQYDNIHFVGCWAKYFGDSQSCWPTFNPEPPYLLVHNMINSSALVYKKKSFLKYGLNRPELEYGMEDWDSVVNMVENSCGGVVLPEFLFNYRVRKGSMARSFTKVKQLYLMRLIGERHKNFYNQYGTEIAHLLNANGSGLYFENPTLNQRSVLAFSLPLPSMVKEKIKNRIKRNKQLRKIAYKIYNRFKK
jgi:glycosyltransferase involved in cell wall biosynthesis